MSTPEHAPSGAGEVISRAVDSDASTHAPGADRGASSRLAASTAVDSGQEFTAHTMRDAGCVGDAIADRGARPQAEFAWPHLTKADVRGWFRVTRTRLHLTLDAIAIRIVERRGVSEHQASFCVEYFERWGWGPSDPGVAQMADVFASFEREREGV
jgi:hypothetical protein